MKIHVPFCSQCGEPAHGTVERLTGVAEFAGSPAPDTDVEYSGWTKVWWDEQRTIHQQEDAPEGPDNLPIVCCAEGHQWPSPIDW